MQQIKRVDMRPASVLLRMLTRGEEDLLLEDNVRDVSGEYGVLQYKVIGGDATTLVIVPLPPAENQRVRVNSFYGPYKSEREAYDDVRAWVDKLNEFGVRFKIIDRGLTTMQP